MGYSNLNISWTATDNFPGTFTIEVEGTSIAIGPLPWTSGEPINYEIPEDLGPGVYEFNIIITDDYGNSASSTITVTITGTPSGGGISFGYTFLTITIASILGLIIIFLFIPIIQIWDGSVEITRKRDGGEVKYFGNEEKVRY